MTGVGPIVLRVGSSETALVATTVLGRAPDLTEASTVALPDPNLSVSRNHVMLRPAADLVEVTDLHSTNGSLITIDGTTVSLVPGEPTLVTVPFTLHCGDATAELFAIAPTPL